jgi:hypothetical protein
MKQQDLKGFTTPVKKEKKLECPKAPIKNTTGPYVAIPKGSTFGNPLQAR